MTDVDPKALLDHLRAGGQLPIGIRPMVEDLCAALLEAREALQRIATFNDVPKFHWAKVIARAALSPKDPT